MNLHLQQDLIYFVQHKNRYGMFFNVDFGKLENILFSVYENSISEHHLYQINCKIISQLYPKIKLDNNFVNIAINKNLNKQKKNNDLL